MYITLDITQCKISLNRYSIFGNFIDTSILRKEEQQEEVLCGYRFETQSSNINDHNHGSFLTYKFTDIGFEIIPDIHGRELVFYYQNTEKVFISNSLYLLTQKLKENCITLEPNIDVMQIESVSNIITQQITSENTFIKNVRILPSHSKLLITANLKLQVICIYPDLTSMSYNDLLFAGSSLIISQLNSIIKFFPHSVLALSGGRDSRCLYAALRFILKEQFQEHITIRTGVYSISDFETVKQLCTLHGYDVNNKLPITRGWRNINIEQALQRYLYGCYGTYYNYDVSNEFYNDKIASIRGGQSNALRYNKHIINNIIRDNKVDRDLCYNHFTNNLNLPFSENTDILHTHYTRWRCRVHYGRVSQKHTDWAFTFDPLMNVYFDRLYENTDYNTRLKGNVHRDLLLLFDKSSLEVDFDSKSKCFSKEFIESSEFFNTPLNDNIYSCNTEISLKYKPIIFEKSQTLNDNFHNDILNIMINTIKSSDLFVFLSQQEHWVHNTAKELKLNNFDSQFVTQNKNQIAKLYQICLLF